MWAKARVCPAFLGSVKMASTSTGSFADESGGHAVRVDRGHCSRLDPHNLASAQAVWCPFVDLAQDHLFSVLGPAHCDAVGLGAGGLCYCVRRLGPGVGSARPLAAQACGRGRLSRFHASPVHHPFGDMANRSPMAIVRETVGGRVCRSVVKAVASITEKRAPEWVKQCKCNRCKAVPRVSALVQIAAALQSNASGKRGLDTDVTSDGDGRCALPHRRPAHQRTLAIAPDALEQAIPFS
ncbi:hypothetical protein pqer_cds_591 [Pandoravirus quercus]|uniref:Uncharacterized protein n=1 Tax=Pandoravirus quercus TaxID=2107709 RepID=A0A2U7U988_9VIRU|nr:hypothetical protein pqer_cds_591 [Pandoravirus quercus]AVK75013.1 hypothetical protein pqer_cds_591 [Pandoravirus quercus]